MQAKYGPETHTTLWLYGREWHKVTRLAPWTTFTAAGPRTVQGLHTTVWTVTGDGTFAGVRHTSRRVDYF